MQLLLRLLQSHRSSSRAVAGPTPEGGWPWELTLVPHSGAENMMRALLPRSPPILLRS